MDQELIQYLSGQFSSIDRRFESIDQRFDSIDQRFESVEDRFDEVKRHTGVLVEGLRYEIQLVAESLTMHIQVQHSQEREYFDRKFDDTHALIRSSYDHLRQRVENLERKQEN